MDSFEFNKIAGALLFTALIIIGLGSLSDIIYAPKHPDKPGYIVEVADAGENTEAKKAPVAEAEVSLASLLASANAEAGQKIFKKCAACHSADKGGKNKVGPNLYNIVGRKMASTAGFSYSSAMKGKAETVGDWSFEALGEFLTKPKAYVPKTKMGFRGLKKPQDVANLLSYLRTLSDSPMALPAAQ